MILDFRLFMLVLQLPKTEWFWYTRGGKNRHYHLISLTYCREKGGKGRALSFILLSLSLALIWKRK